MLPRSAGSFFFLIFLIFNSRSSTPVKRERFCRDGKSIKEIAKSVQRKNFQGIPKTLEDLRSILHTSEIPDKMPCREEEFEVIRRFVVEGVKGVS